jgi:hypothetical protein
VRFSSPDVCERVDELGMLDEGTYTQNIHNLFTRSHPSEEKNRTRSRTKNCKCKWAFIQPALHIVLCLDHVGDNLKIIEDV